MKNLIFLISSLFLLIACSKNNEEEIRTYPNCIKSKIDSYLQNPVNNPKTYIKKYMYNSKTVYLINTNNPDGALNTVYDENCNIVCANGGTIAGEAFDTCIDWDKATFIETVWTDPR